MQENHLFEYAVVRIVPRVEREEFLNVGVIVYCAAEKFLQIKYYIDKNRLQHFSSEIELDEIEKRLEVFEKICSGNIDGGAIATLPLASRFRWLTAAKSTIVQTSAVHPGLCDDAQKKLEKLFIEMVI